MIHNPFHAAGRAPAGCASPGDGHNGSGAGSGIDLHNVVKSFKSEAGEVTVLKGINLHFNPGEFVGVIGKSGSGKSTMINMITGIDRPSAGDVCVDGTPVSGLRERQMAAWRGRTLGIVFQFFQLLPTLSLVDNVMLPMDFCGVYKPAERPKRAMDLLGLVGMADHANKLPTAISGGQQQRVAIARALANDPPVIVADEPTGNLDSKTAQSVFDLFETLVAGGKTVVMVTHDGALAKRVARTVLIADGEVVNEYVSRALPTLTIDEMLLATHKLEPVHYAAGERILHEDQPADRFYIITKGTVQIALKRPDGNELTVARMAAGQYFGEIELLRGGRTLADVTAADGPVEALTLDRETFADLLAESEATRSALDLVAGQRLQENEAARGQN